MRKNTDQVDQKQDLSDSLSVHSTVKKESYDAWDLKVKENSEQIAVLQHLNEQLSQQIEELQAERGQLEQQNADLRSKIRSLSDFHHEQIAVIKSLYDQVSVLEQEFMKHHASAKDPALETLVAQFSKDLDHCRRLKEQRSQQLHALEQECTRTDHGTVLCQRQNEELRKRIEKCVQLIQSQELHIHQLKKEKHDQARLFKQQLEYVDSIDLKLKAQLEEDKKKMEKQLHLIRSQLNASQTIQEKQQEIIKQKDEQILDLSVEIQSYSSRYTPSKTYSDSKY